MDKESIICQQCQERILDVNAKCLKCNSGNKIINVEFNENIELFHSIETKRKNNNLPSKKKEREKYFEGQQQSYNGEWVNKENYLNRDTNEYFEIVLDAKGNIIHFCKEDLSAHRNKGSAKFKK